MNKINILIFALLVFACEGFNDPDSPYIEQYVVFANISANKPMIDDTVFVSRTASLDAVSYTHLTLPTILRV